MRASTVLAVGAGAALAVTAALLVSGTFDSAAESVVVPTVTHRTSDTHPMIKARQPVPPREPRVPAVAYRRFPPGSRIQMRVPRTKSGIPLPDGTFLPLLNGVTAAPAVSRDAWLGPVPPVVAKIVDDTGVEWWEHADGSATTTRYVSVTYEGKTHREVVTDHAAKVPEKYAIPKGNPVAGGPKGSGQKLGPRIK